MIERARYGLLDLHLHLDGSLSPELALTLAEREGCALPAKEPEFWKQRMQVPEGCRDLNQYLSCFDVVLPLLQSADALYMAAADVARRLSRQGLFYGEVRFAPLLHGEKGLTQEGAVEAVVSGLQSGCEKGRKLSVLLCCMRGAQEKANRHTVECARKYLGKGVVGLDLAGAEALYPTRLYREIFLQANRWDIPYTIHAGEAAGPESVWEALSFGAVRIGHGVRAGEDPNLLETLALEQIPLEFCPTSNLQTRAVSGWERYPLREFLQRGIRVTVNSDNATVSGTTVEKEFCRVIRELGVTEKEAASLVENALEAAFLSDREKTALREAVKGVSGLR